MHRPLSLNIRPNAEISSPRVKPIVLPLSLKSAHVCSPSYNSVETLTSSPSFPRWSPGAALSRLHRVPAKHQGEGYSI